MNYSYNQAKNLEFVFIYKFFYLLRISCGTCAAKYRTTGGKKDTTTGGKKDTITGGKKRAGRLLKLFTIFICYFGFRV